MAPMPQKVMGARHPWHLSLHDPVREHSQFTFTMVGGWVVKNLEKFVNLYCIKIVNVGGWVVKNL